MTRISTAPWLAEIGVLEAVRGQVQPLPSGSKQWPAVKKRLCAISVPEQVRVPLTLPGFA
ncbi:hypothetical protein BE20_11700 [Sorangium cellulosum]|nr:hypothetical protein BE20_11700 [Sorangium cellulosum]